MRLKHISQEEIVKAKLKATGYVDNLWAINNFILRLSSVIFRLKQQGYIFKSEFGTGRNKKNYYYKLIGVNNKESNNYSF